MVELVTELPPESLTASEVERLRERPGMRGVIELPTGNEHRRNVTSTATVLAERTVLYLALDAESGQWHQQVLARDAGKRDLLEATLDRLDSTEGGTLSNSN